VGLSLADLADRVHYSKGYLSKIENGRHPAGIDLLRRCDAVLGAEGKLVALAKRCTTSLPDEDTDEDRTELWVMGMAGDGTGWAMPMSRRDAVLAGMSSWMGLRLAPRQTRSPAALRPAVNGVRATFDQIRRLGQVAGPGLVLPMMITQTQAVRGMAATAHDSGEHTTLLQLAARCAEFTGWMAQEAGDDRVALGWTRTAVEIAEQAGDRELGAHALVRQALITLYQDDPAQTIELARRARAEPGASPRVRGFAALREAQGHALAGDYDGCQRALDDGRKLLAGTEDADMPLGPTSVPDISTVVAGWCLYDLGRTDDAADVLGTQFAGMPTASRRARARYGVRLARAYLGADRVGEACQLLDQLLDDVDVVDSATIRYDLRRFYLALPKWHAHPHARDLHARLPALLRVPID
jgi:transcriptional regulator with XRE-family HTH domain